jgi:hypothetical protein
MNTNSQLAGAWCAPAFALVLFVGWCLIGGFMPPHLPSADGQQIVAFYTSDLVRIRLGLLLFMWGSALYLPFAAVLTVQMMRIEGRYPVWSFTQLAAGAGNVITLTFPTLFWATAAFRPDRSPELVQLINDLAWIPFVGMTSPFLMVPISIAIVGFMDKSENPVFPRWACYFNLVVEALLLPGGLIIFFQSGPFAWNGLFGIWIPLIAWGSWFFVTSYLLIKAIKRQAAEK